MKAFWIILIIILITVPAAFWFFSQNNQSQPQPETTAVNTQSAPATGEKRSGESSTVARSSGEDIIKSLSRLKKVTLNISFFQENRFRELVDLSVAPPEIVLGRFNPFAPISGIIAPVAASSTVTLFGR